MRLLPKASPIFLFSMLFLLTSYGPLAAQTPGAGAIAGRVLESSGAPLPGAQVAIEGANLSTSTDRDGYFRLSPVAAGATKVLVRYLGLDDQQATRPQCRRSHAAHSRRLNSAGSGRRSIRDRAGHRTTTQRHVDRW